jgi:hypothetical protein
VIQQLRRSAHALRDIGEERQADAYDADAASMERRARLHLRGLVARSTDSELGATHPGAAASPATSSLVDGGLVPSGPPSIEPTTEERP